MAASRPVILRLLPTRICKCSWGCRPRQCRTLALTLERPHEVVLWTALERMTACATSTPIRDRVANRPIGIELSPQPTVAGQPVVGVLVHHGVCHGRAAVSPNILEDDRPVRELRPSG